VCAGAPERGKPCPRGCLALDEADLTRGVGLSPRARRTPPEGALRPRARRTPPEGALRPRARWTPPEGASNPRARRTSLEGRPAMLP
jgi:hypothetical protein